MARLFVLLIAFSLALPESYARRLGGGRSAGRQAPITRQRAMPPPLPRQRSLPAQSNAAPPPRSQPDVARQTVPPAAPAQPVRQAGNQWGGMLGGALLGLGLGSLMSSGNRNVDAANQNPAAQSSGGNGGNGTAASGADESQTSPAPAAEQPQENRLGSVVLLGIIALAVYFLIRRIRARASQRRG